ncbi:MAG: hypothetical protein AAF383_07960 [Cyanobacteria bacterium P01_A01_bin.83]
MSIFLIKLNNTSFLDCLNFWDSLQYLVFDLPLGTTTHKPKCITDEMALGGYGENLRFSDRYNRIERGSTRVFKKIAAVVMVNQNYSKHK